MLYEPQEDSYLLKKYIKEFVRDKKVLDMGCGAGILSLEAKKYTYSIVSADINPEAVSFCLEQGLNACVSDLFSNLKEKFDVILFNPPYLPFDEDEALDSALATTGGKEGHEVIERFLKDAKEYLTLNGKILLVSSSLTGDLETLFENYGFSFEVLEKESHFFEELKLYLLSPKVL